MITDDDVDIFDNADVHVFAAVVERETVPVLLGFSKVLSSKHEFYIDQLHASLEAIENKARQGKARSASTACATGSTPTRVPSFPLGARLANPGM